MKIPTVCSGCMRDVVVDEDAGTVTVRVPSNRVRGAGHVPAHDLTTEVGGDDDLLTWDCPACGYADSYDLTQ